MSCVAHPVTAVSSSEGERKSAFEYKEGWKRKIDRAQIRLKLKFPPSSSLRLISLLGSKEKAKQSEGPRRSLCPDGVKFFLLWKGKKEGKGRFHRFLLFVLTFVLPGDCLGKGPRKDNCKTGD